MRDGSQRKGGGWLHGWREKSREAGAHAPAFQVAGKGRHSHLLPDLFHLQCPQAKPHPGGPPLPFPKAASHASPSRPS